MIALWETPLKRSPPTGAALQESVVTFRAHLAMHQFVL
jgi:hypothetical protein